MRIFTLAATGSLIILLPLGMWTIEKKQVPEVKMPALYAKLPPDLVFEVKDSTGPRSEIWRPEVEARKRNIRYAVWSSDDMSIAAPGDGLAPKGVGTTVGCSHPDLTGLGESMSTVVPPSPNPELQIKMEPKGKFPELDILAMRHATPDRACAVFTVDKATTK